jgi:hypothetical protein
MVGLRIMTVVVKLDRSIRLFWKSTNSTKIFNGLQNSFQVWQGFINVLESFSYKDFLFILATEKGKKISELILPSDFDSPSLYGTSKRQQI